MDTQTLKDEIAWYHGCIAGMANLDAPDPSVMAHLVRELEARWELYEAARTQPSDRPEASTSDQSP